MLQNKGGRGKEAPYKTTIVRVLDDVKVQVEAINSTCRELKLLGKENELHEFIDRVESAIVSTVRKDSTKVLTYEQVEKVANEVLTSKQSAPKTIKKLLQVLNSINDVS